MNNLNYSGVGMSQLVHDLVGCLQEQDSTNELWAGHRKCPQWCRCPVSKQVRSFAWKTLKSQQARKISSGGAQPTSKSQALIQGGQEQPAFPDLRFRPRVTRAASRRGVTINEVSEALLDLFIDLRQYDLAVISFDSIKMGQLSFQVIQEMALDAPNDPRWAEHKVGGKCRLLDCVCPLEHEVKSLIWRLLAQN